MQRRQGPGSRQLTDGLPARRTGPQYSATLARRSGSVLAKAKMGGGGGGGWGVVCWGARGGAGQAGAQVSEQRLDLVRAHGDRARQAQVILRLHQPALRGAAARSVFKGANVGVTWPAPVTVGARAWPTKGGGLLSLSGRMRQ